MIQRKPAADGKRQRDPHIENASFDAAGVSGAETTRRRWAVKLDFVGANPDVRPRGEEETGAKVSYFKGPKDQWKTGLNTYSRIVYPDRTDIRRLSLMNGCGDREHAQLEHPYKYRRKPMNLRIRTLATLVTIALTACLFSLPQATLADDNSNCKDAKGNLSVVNNGNGTTSGTITQGGKLNGTTQAVFTSALTPTPDPSTFSYTDDFTVTTNKGVLRTHNVGIFDVATGLFSEIARIDPSASTGDFAGATGVLYINGKTTDGGASFQAEITGEICFAN